MVDREFLWCYRSAICNCTVLITRLICITDPKCIICIGCICDRCRMRCFIFYASLFGRPTADHRIAVQFHLLACHINCCYGNALRRSSRIKASAPFGDHYRCHTAVSKITPVVFLFIRRIIVIAYCNCRLCYIDL